MRTNLGTFLILAMLAMLVWSNPMWAQDGLAGTYKGHQILITITGTGPQYTGTIEMHGRKFPFTAAEKGGTLYGKFTAEGDAFDFSASISGSMLSFETDGTTYICQRQQPAAAAGAQNPLARGRTPAGPKNPLARDSGPARSGPQPSSPAAQSKGAAASMRFTLLSVKDPGINNIECVSFLIPAGWKVEGGVQWFPDYSILANLLMRISDPETGAAIEFLPIQNFTHLSNPVMPMQRGSNYMGCIVWEPVQDIPTLVQTFYAPKTLPHLQNARLVADQELPGVAEEYARMYGGGSRVKSGRARYEYQINGQPWEEDIYATIVYTDWQLGTMWSVPSSYSFRAPRGMLDRMTPIMRPAIGSMRLNLDWYAGYMHVQNLFNKRMNQSIRNARAISETIARNSEEIRRMYSDSYRQSCESQDRISASFSEYIRGVDTYKNPYEDRQIQLPAGYRDAWVNGRGEYILSNDSGFNPNVGDTMEWRRMDRRDGG